jgi:hypothetical protein
MPTWECEDSRRWLHSISRPTGLLERMNFILSARLHNVVTFHATVFSLLKWLTKKIDKHRRNFYWKWDDTQENKGGACFKWDVICRPKNLNTQPEMLRKGTSAKMDLVPLD